MNLYTPANGTLETHVTWKDIEQDLQRELFTAAIFGPHKSAQDVEHGNGFMSKMVLVEPDWQSRGKIHCEVPGCYRNVNASWTTFSAITNGIWKC